MNKKKTAIFGCGSISQTHIAALDALGISQITALCDTDKSRLDAALKKCPGAVGYTDYKELLTKADVDVVHVCSPHYLHADMAIAAMERGCDVYLEKPCAMNCAEAEKIVHASEICGKKVCVSFQNRLINTTLTAKEIINSGEMGKLLGAKCFVAWHRSGKYYTESGWRGKFATEGGGVLMNQAIHTLDLLYYFLGEPESVKGHASLNRNVIITDVEDTAEAFIHFKNGATAIFYATNCNVVNSDVEIELYFEKGSLLVRNESLYCVTADGMTEICKNENLLDGKSYWGNGHMRMIGNFYSALDGKDCYFCDIKDSVPVLKIIAEIYKNSDIRPDII
ncbi:MAG: Gfo/Idh/MocA family oxidoreductase [Clostridia bacterium]|nr:Gfo/Idh/MocA family oxidoreductase [Clostridia bacterium]